MLGAITVNYGSVKSCEAHLNQCILIKCQAASYFQ